jgi:hypothetical protein
MIINSMLYLVNIAFRLLNKLLCSPQLPFLSGADEKVLHNYTRLCIYSLIC